MSPELRAPDPSPSASEPIPRPAGPTSGGAVAPCRSGRNVAVIVGVVVVVVVAAFATLVGVPSFGAAATPPAAAPSSGLAAAGTIGPGCNPESAKYATPTALLIPNSNPSGSVAPGDHVNVTFEFKVDAETIKPNAVGINVYTPTVFTSLPEVGGGSYPATFNNHTFTIPGPVWVPLSFDKLVTSNVTFLGGASATLSTQKVGIMADTPYGTLKLEFRWSWNITYPNGTFDQGPWTVPSLTFSQGVVLPSIFKPAPYVDLTNESPANDYIGSVYTMDLSGDVSDRNFYIEFETQAGALKAAEWQNDTASTNATFVATIPLLGFGGSLTPGLYLVHIHDSCGAMLYSKRVTLTYAPYAIVNFVTTPSGCGTVTFDGTPYTNGEFANVTPGSTPYSYAFHACTGYTISNWSFEGALRQGMTGEVVVSAGGTFIANFKPG